jgi:putative ABC transport system permease protein
MIPISYNFRSLAARRSTTAAAALGIALVVWVFASAMMLSAGIKKTLKSSGRADNAIVLRKGSQAELTSGIEEQTVSLLRASPEAASDGTKPIATGELVMVIAANKSEGDGIGNLVIRGVTADSYTVHDQVRISEGRPFKAGTDEVIVGSGIVGRYKGLTLGAAFPLKANRNVTVVGTFQSDGSSFESEIWGDLDSVRAIFNRSGSVSSVTVRLKSAGELEAMKARVEADPRLGLDVKREVTYYEEMSEGLSLFFNILGIMISVFFSAGAMIGAMITMYAQVSQRSREIGTLRALGFRGRAVLLSFLIEAILLSLAGGLLGLVAALGMSFVEIATISFTTFSEIVFRLTATPEIMMTALLFAMVMGVLGGFLPALRAAKVSPVEAMRA